MKYSPTHSISVDGKPVWVFDDLCTTKEAEDLYKGLQASGFKKDEIARPDTEEYKHWAVNLTAEQVRSLPVYHRAMEAIEALTQKSYRAYRGYVNHAAFGDMLFTHTDCEPSADEFTVLAYISPEWNIEWGGETLFFNDQDDCLFACSPKPARVAIFHGAIKHVGRPPNRICYAPRFTLAFKLERASS